MLFKAAGQLNLLVNLNPEHYKIGTGTMYKS